jgi:hypothetical protein
MKLKLVVVDLEMPAHVEKWSVRIGLPLAILFGGSAVAWAAGLHTWNPGDTLFAGDLNANFAGLDTRITALEAPISKVSLSGVAPFTLTGNTGDNMEFVVVPYAMKTVDDLNEYNMTDHTFTAQQAGDYEVCASLSSNGGGPVFELDTFVNGLRERSVALAQATSTPIGGGCLTIRLMAKDSLDVEALQVGAFASSVSTDGNWDWMTISRLR